MATTRERTTNKQVTERRIKCGTPRQPSVTNRDRWRGSREVTCDYTSVRAGGDNDVGMVRRSLTDVDRQRRSAR